MSMIGKGRRSENRKFYTVWYSIRDRIKYCKYYRGLTVCRRWYSYDNFKEDLYDDFLKHVELFGEKNTSLDRINNKIGYRKSNCRWTTLEEQSRNRSVVRKVILNGKKVTMKEAAKITKLPYKTIMARIARGQSPEDAIKRKLHYYRYDLSGLTVKLLAEKLNITSSLVRSRLRAGWTERDIKNGYKKRKKRTGLKTFNEETTRHYPTTF